MTNAVSEQSTIVSTKTSKMPTTPCSAGCRTRAMPCAMGALPRPASFESTPRLTPAEMACDTEAPTKPPSAAVGANALPTISPNISGTRPMWMTRNASAVAT